MNDVPGDLYCRANEIIQSPVLFELEQAYPEHTSKQGPPYYFKLSITGLSDDSQKLRQAIRKMKHFISSLAIAIENDEIMVRGVDEKETRKKAEALLATWNNPEHQAQIIRDAAELEGAVKGFRSRYPELG